MKTSSAQKVLVLSALLLGVAVVVFHALSKPAPASKEVAQVSSYLMESVRWQDKYLPDFTLRLRNGESFALSDHVGREVVVLNFFTTWCGPCKEEMPELNSFCLKHKNDPFVFVAVNVDEKPEIVDAFFRELKLSFPVGIDTNRVISSQYEIQSYRLPRLFRS